MTKHNPYPALRDPQKLGTRQFFTIQIRHIPTNQITSFEGWVTEFSDSYSTTWNSEMVYGRMDPLATFQGTRRSISLGFDVVSDSIEHAAGNLQNIAKLIKFLYPVYDKNPRSQQNVLKAGPLLGMRWTNLISNAGMGDAELIGYIDGNLQYSPDMGEGGFMAPGILPLPDLSPKEEKRIQEETPGVILSDRSGMKGIRNYIPKKISLGFTFNVLHTHLVGWAPNDASNTSFTFGGNKDVQNDFPFVRSTFPEPQNQFGELPEEGRPETSNDEAARRQILENIGD